MKLSFVEKTDVTKEAVAAFAYEGGELTPAAKALDDASGGALSRAQAAARFNGKKGQSLTILSPGTLTQKRVVLFGLGTADALKDEALEALGARIYKGLSHSGAAQLEVLFDLDGLNAALLASGALLRSYRFDKYRTTEKAEDKPGLKGMTFLVADAKAARRNFKRLEKIADGVFFTRDLVSEPPNTLYPASFAEELKALEKLGVEVDILGEKDLAELGCGSLLGVGQGSARDSRMVVMHWRGGKKKDKPVALIGKGVTFDTGGISLKPAGGMEDMKWDMGGAGVVAGTLKALAGRKAKCNVVGVVGLVENMPDGAAQRPGDVVTSLSGQTIEVINTDAEGRLVLADALWYAKETCKPALMIDLATLTGAIMVALGHEYAGLFSNSDTLAAQLTDAGLETGEKLWRLPLGPEYDKQIKSQIADMKNIGGGRMGGSIIAAQFLQRFVDGTDWAHLDIAGVTWSNKDKDIVPKGGTGFGVRLLDRFIAENHEGS